MKKIIYIIALFIGISSCTSVYDVDPYNSYEDRKTGAGKMIYDETQNVLINYSATFEFARVIDAYLQETDKEKRDSIKYYHLSDYSILEKGDSVLLKTSNYGSYNWAIYRSSKASLDTPNTKWNMIYSYYYSYGIVNTNRFGITTQTDANTWKLEIKDYVDYVRGLNTISSADLLLNIVDKDPKDDDSKYIYSFTDVENGVNEIKAIEHNDREPFITTYKIVEPMTYEVIKLKPTFFSSISGFIDMDLLREKDQTEDITAEIENEGRNVSITFRGITELW